MDNPRHELLDYTHSQIGKPFMHHFKPNMCDGGNITLNQCMEKGMDELGFDCMGLVIAGVCRSLGIPTTEWPRAYRHNLQLYDFATPDRPELGDIVLIESNSATTGIPYSTHSGIYVDGSRIVHANGRSKIVDESTPMGVITRTTTIKTVDLLNAIKKSRESLTV